MDPHSFIARAEAQRWIGIAEKLLVSHDLVGSKTFAIRARESDPRLEAADQILAIADTLLSAEKRLVGSSGNQQPDYYAILQLVRFVQDTDHIASQYRRLAVILNPHHNRFPYSDQAFQLVNDAWAVLSNPMRKSMYDSQLDFAHQQPQINNLGFNIEQQQQQHPHQHHNPNQHHHHQQQQQHNFFSINQELAEPQQTFQTRLQPSHQQHQQLQQHNFLSQPNAAVREHQEQLFHHRDQQEQLFQPQVQPFQVTSTPHQQTRPPPQPPQPQPQPIQSPPRPAVASTQSPFSWPQAPPLSQPQQQTQQHLQQEQQKQTQLQQQEQREQEQRQQERQQQEQREQEQRQQHEQQQQEPLQQNAAPVEFLSQVNSNINGVTEEETEAETEAEPEEVVEDVDDSPTFWTTCPYCFYMYEYPSVYADCTLRCDNCKRAFQAVRISSPPVIVEGQEAYFYSWGFFPIGVSMSHLQSKNNKGATSKWTPFSPLYISNNVQNHLNEYAAPKENTFVNKSSGPRIYIDDYTDDVFIGVSEPSDDSDVEWGSTKKRKSTRMRKDLEPSFKERVQVLALGAIDPKNGGFKNLKLGIPVQEGVVVPTVPVAEAIKKTVVSNPRKQSGVVAKEFGKLDLNVEFNNNEGEEPAQRITTGARGHGHGEEDNIEGIGFFEGLDEFLSSLPILSVVNEEKVKVA